MPQLEWDVLVPLACAAYNFIPNEHSKESSFFLMFGRDPVLTLNTLLEPKMRYLENDMNILSLEAMKNMFEIATTKLKMAWERRDPKNDPRPSKLQPGDTVLVRNHTKGPFDPKYIGDYHVVLLKGNQIEVRPSIGGPTEMKYMIHVKFVLPADQYVKHVPDYSAFRRKATLRMNLSQIPDLHWQLEDTYHTTNIVWPDLHISNMSTISMDVLTLSYPGGKKYENACRITINIDTTTIDSNVNTIVCSTINKT